MKIVTEKRNQTAVGIQDTREFTVKAGAHIMAVLSGLYSNPVDAIVREYLTNMYDAYKALWRKHGKNGKHIPPRLILPSAFSSELVFMDYGIGMDKDTVWNIFTSYGETTKNDSNDEVGGFGLGSKTAFCYNGGTAWTVESRFEGMKHLFIAAIGTNNIPRLDHVSSEPTDEHSGVTIRIPIRRNDIQQVVVSAQKYVPYFPAELGLEVDGAGPIEPIKHLYAGATWGLSPAPDNYHRGIHSDNYHRGIRIVMGNVPYVWDNNEPLPTRHQNRNNFHAVNRIDIVVPIGSVDIVPSRDNLKYSDRTKNTVRESLAVFHSELEQEMSRRLNQCKTEWEAHEQIHKMNDIPYLFNVISTLRWNNKEINQIRGIERKVTDFKKLNPSMELKVYGNESSYKSTMEEQNVDVLQMRLDGFTFLVRDDLTSGTVKAVKSLLHEKLVNKTGNGRAARWGHKMGHAIVVKSSLTDKAISDFFGGVPVDRILLASSLTGYKVPPSIRHIGKDTLYRFSPSTYRWESRVRIPTDKTMYYYLPLEKANNGRYMYHSNEATSNVLVVAQHFNLINDDSPVYGIKSNEVSKFDSAVWKPLLPAIEESVMKWAEKNPVAAQVMLYRNASLATVANLVNDVKAKNEHPSLTRLCEYQSYYIDRDVRALERYVQEKNNLFKKIEKYLKTTDVPSSTTVITNVLNTFPMLDVLVNGGRTYYSTDQKKVILDYIKSRC